MAEPRLQVIILMGVSGAGKTTVGRALANRLGWRFFDADDFHPPQNIAKMSRGEPLNDEDRRPWLAALAELITQSLNAAEPTVLAVSALKASYRAQLRIADPRVGLVYLRGTYDLIYERMDRRPDHFFDAELLSSQFAALEEPEEAVVIDVAQSAEEIVDAVCRRLGL